MVKKIVLTIMLVSVITGACLWAGATWLFGAGVESALSQTPDPATEDRIFSLHHEVERGFLSSKARSRIALSESELDDLGIPEASLMLNHEVFHGPLALTPDGPIICSNYLISTIDLGELDEEVREKISQLFQGEPPVVIRTTTNLGRSGNVRITVAPVRLEGAAGSEQQMEFDGMDVTINATMDESGQLKYASGEATIGRSQAKWLERTIVTQPGDGFFEYHSDQSFEGRFTFGATTSTFPEGTLRIGSLQLEVNQQRASQRQMLFLGDSRLELAELTFVSEIGEMGLKNAMIQATSGNDNGKLFGSVKYGIGEMSVPPLLAGPVAPFLPAMQKGLSVEVGASGFDLGAVESLMESAQKMQAAQWDQIAAGSATSKLDAAQKKVLIDYFNGVLDLFSPGIAVTQGIEIVGMTGSSRMDLKLSLAGDQPLRQKTTLRALVESVAGELSLTVNKGDLPADQVGAMAAGLTSSGFLIDGPSAITGKALLGNGILQVNGEPTPLIESLGEMLEQPILWDEIINQIDSL